MFNYNVDELIKKNNFILEDVWETSENFISENNDGPLDWLNVTGDHMLLYLKTHPVFPSTLRALQKCNFILYDNNFREFLSLAIVRGPEFFSTVIDYIITCFSSKNPNLQIKIHINKQILSRHQQFIIFLLANKGDTISLQLEKILEIVLHRKNLFIFCQEKYAQLLVKLLEREFEVEEIEHIIFQSYTKRKNADVSYIAAGLIEVLAKYLCDASKTYIHNYFLFYKNRKRINRYLRENEKYGDLISSFLSNADKLKASFVFNCLPETLIEEKFSHFVEKIVEESDFSIKNLQIVSSHSYFQSQKGFLQIIDHLKTMNIINLDKIINNCCQDFLKISYANGVCKSLEKNIFLEEFAQFKEKIGTIIRKISASINFKDQSPQETDEDCCIICLCNPPIFMRTICYHKILCWDCSRKKELVNYCEKKCSKCRNEIRAELFQIYPKSETS